MMPDSVVTKVENKQNHAVCFVQNVYHWNTSFTKIWFLFGTTPEKKYFNTFTNMS